MISRRLVSFVIVTGLTIFVGCTPNGQSPSGIANVWPPVSSPPKAQGTVDSGGGNTFNGRPLESYAINIRELPAFKEGVSPILESNGLQDSLLRNVLNSIIDKKTWYLIPSELTQLPSEKIASAVGADQAALQDFKQIWLNQNIFDKMSIQDQSLLVVHELLMGLRLLKFDSALSECLAFRSASQEESFCKNSYSSEIRGKPSDLNSSDYAQIRATAKKLSEGGQKLSLADLNDLLGIQGFSTDDHEFKVKASQKILSIEDLGKMTQTSMLTKSWPTYGFDFNKLIMDHPEMLKPGGQLPNMTWKSDQKCDFSIVTSSDSFSISLNENGGTKTYSSRWTSHIEANLRKDQITKLYFYNVATPILKITESTKQGDEVLFVTLAFLDDFLQSAYLEKALCLNSTCSETGAAIDSFKVMCYTRASLDLNSKK